MSDKLDLSAVADQLGDLPSGISQPAAEPAAVAGADATKSPDAAPSSPPAATPPQSTTDQPVPQAGALASYLKELGLGELPAGTDEREVLRSWIEGARSWGQVQQDPYFAHYRQNLPQIHAYLAEQQKQAQAQPEAKPFWAPPASRAEVEDYLRRYFTTDPATGELVPKPTAPPDAVQKVHAYRQYTDQWSQKLVNDPEAALAPLLDQLVARRLDEQMSRWNRQWEASALLGAHQNELFTKDALGRQSFTPLGQAYADAVKQLEASRNDQRAQHAIAMALAHARTQPQAPAAAPDPKAQQHVLQNNRVPSRAAHEPSARPVNLDRGLRSALLEGLNGFAESEFDHLFA